MPRDCEHCVVDPKAKVELVHSFYRRLMGQALARSRAINLGALDLPALSPEAAACLVIRLQRIYNFDGSMLLSCQTLDVLYAFYIFFGLTY